MTRTVHIAIQVVFTVLQFLPPIINWPPEGAPRASWNGLISALQAALGAWAQGSNPDGTPASQPYKPKG